MLRPTADHHTPTSNYKSGITLQLALGEAAEATCLDCGRTKLRDQFNDNWRVRRGHSPYCKACSLAHVRIARGVHRDDAYMVCPDGHRCDICGDAGSERGLFLDHDHTTGRFRGWLCHGCNSAIGQLSDDPQLLGAAISYLTRAAARATTSSEASSW